ncbi:trimeric intracellular cation channel family protein [Lampropedia puyangensis]|uniref:Trimeric intracellular cation channel family protein n=2 Tax=Lampropedia puyangensis TaxID=1330072 RepID=A0A4S8F0Z0_9BURK|nr:trimeric intracellular cation channel family protein [Lampropedia puyangensis]
MLTPDDFIRALDWMGTVVFALSGVLIARRLQMDGFGLLVLASVTAIGGGTIRDLVLGIRPVFWVTQSHYLVLIVVTCALAIPLARLLSRAKVAWLLLHADALGLATFTAIGANKALSVGAPAIVAVGMGVLTGVGGGVIRDVLAREVPMVLCREVYATACIAGGIVLTAVHAWTGQSLPAMLGGMLTTWLIRLAALRWHWHLPTFGGLDPDESR